MPHKQVLLREDIDNLGGRGEVVRVKAGYARNYLLPRKLAIEATSGNRSVIDEMKAAAQRRSVREKGDAEGLAKQFESVHLTFMRKAGDREHLFGSVTGSDIAQEMEARGFNIDRRKIQLDEPLKTVGDFDVQIKLHREVSAPIKVTIKPDTE